MERRRAERRMVVRNHHQNDYTTLDRVKSILILLAIIANVAVWGTVLYREITKPEPVIGVDYFPMANQHITWTWAEVHP